MKSRSLFFSLIVISAITACGGSDSESPPQGGGGENTTSSPPTWSAGIYANETQFKNFCSAPRQGTDPYNNNAAYPDKAGSAMHEKMWLRSWSQRTYLWYKELADIDPTTYAIDAYFSLLKTTQTTASGAAKDQFHFHLNTADYNQQSQSGVVSGYGIEWSVTSAEPPRSFTVAYTEPNSPAALMGVQRGDSLRAINGIDFVNDGTQAGVNQLNAALFPSLLGQSHVFKFQRVNGSSYETTLTSATVISSPVQNAQVINTKVGRLGYFQFNSYISPAQAPLISTIKQFQDQAISNVVVDLRYNGGGLLALSSQLAYMMTGPNLIQGRTFERMQFNDKYPNTNPVTGEQLNPTPFYAKEIDYYKGQLTSQTLPSLNLTRVFVLSSENTCSASEAFINGLRGIDVEVVLIGTTTCGKPYGFYPTDNCGTTYFTIQFSGVNAKGFGDFAAGFAPVAQPQFDDEVKGCVVADDFSKPLGSPQEALLAAAISYAETGSCPVALSPLNQGLQQTQMRKATSGLPVQTPSSSLKNNSIRIQIQDVTE